jgi:hypothetical protein
MRTHRLTAVVALIVSLWGPIGLAGRAADLSGTWSFSVDVGGTHGDPTFVFKQRGETLTGTVTNARGEQPITGTVKGDKAVFGFGGTRDGQTFKATYSGTVESPTRMKGTVEFVGALSGTGTWVATRK